MLKAFIDRILARNASQRLDQFLDDVLDHHCRLSGLPRTPDNYAGHTAYQDLGSRLFNAPSMPAEWEAILAPVKDRYPEASTWALRWICDVGARFTKTQAKASQLGERALFWVDPLPYLMALVRQNPPPETADVLADWLLEGLREMMTKQTQLRADVQEFVRQPVRLLLYADGLDAAGPLVRGRGLVREIVALHASQRQGRPTNYQSSEYRVAEAILTAYTVPLFNSGLLAETELDALLLEYPPIIALFGRNRPAEHAAWFAACGEAVRRIQARLLAGDSDPNLNQVLDRYQHYQGIDHFLAACRFIEMHPEAKLPIDQWGYSADTLGWTARLLRVLPAPGPDDLARASELSAISPQTLQTATLLAPSWAPLAEARADWPAWGRIVRWLAQYGGVQPWSDGASANQDEDEGGGAVDRETVVAAFAVMGEKRFKQLLKHRIARGLYRNGLFYAEAVLGRNGADVEARFLKRDKLAVVALGMLPDEEDILQRYLALRKFAKESRQFGAQRQASEALAVERALTNLAVTAGYEDRVQLEWSMEARLVDELDPGRRWQVGEYTVWIDSDESATIRVEREGKPLKSVPPAVRQAEEYAEIKDAREQLQAQWDRVRRRLDLAMVLGEVMDRDTFAPALVTPAGQAMLPHLVLRSWVAGEPVVAFGTASGAERYQILHPLDLASEGVLAEWQARLVADGKLQPFNQLFREYYAAPQTETDRRFSGRKVRVGTLVEKLKRRGWHPAYEGALLRRLPGRGQAEFWFEDGVSYMGAMEMLTAGGIHFAGNRSERAVSEALRDVDLATFAASPDKSTPVSDEMLTARRALARAYGAADDGEYASGKGWRLHLGTGAAFDAAGSPIELRISDRKGDFPYADPDSATADVMARLIHLTRRK